MMRSLYAGVTGLRNHQTRLDVIGSNIANVNTVGFKKSRVTFRDALYQNLRGASMPQGNRGGTNPQQVGLGMNLSTIDVIQEGSSSQTTGKTTDLCIQGDGFFIISDGGLNFYTRAGIFDFDTEGNFYNMSNGYKVMGYLADTNGVLDLDNLVPISISNYSSVPPQATTEVKLSGNIDAKTPIADDILTPENTPGCQKFITKTVYDSLGVEHSLEIILTRDDTAVGMSGTYQVSCKFDGVDAPPSPATTIQFDSLGQVSVTAPATPTFNIAVSGLANGAEDMDITVDFTPITHYNAESTIWAESQNGYQQGDLKNYTIDVTGTIVGSYSNGRTKNIAQVATASFQNPSGLLQMGETIFQVSNNSGDAMIGRPGTGGRGSLIPGSLEMSNVDLSQEFTDMIVTQRGFQANSRIITTTDEMLQELVNLKR